MTQSLVSCEWLFQHKYDAHIRIIDASYYLPNEAENAYDSFVSKHIEGAVFFDIDACCDVASPYPHMLPSASQFAMAVGALGISREDHVIIYDQKGLFSAARLWWMLLVFGHDASRVSVLDGGLLRWFSLNYPVESGIVSLKPANYNVAQVLSHKVAQIEDMHYAISSHDALIVDARGKARFDGLVPEPRQGVRSGHMPTSINIPYASLLDEPNNTLKSQEQLAQIFEQNGIDTSSDVLLSCGSGVTACVVLLAMQQCGLTRARIYDGSWSEWGARDDTPVEVSECEAA